jgi:NADP-dependent 3-hydroxy acid dehydrogenase YdfG
MAILSGRIALVTGASSGLGERFAETLRGAGAEVVITARRAARLEQLADRSGSIVLAGDVATLSTARRLQQRSQIDSGGSTYSSITQVYATTGRSRTRLSKSSRQ